MKNEKGMKLISSCIFYVLAFDSVFIFSIRVNLHQIFTTWIWQLVGSCLSRTGLV